MTANNNVKESVSVKYFEEKMENNSLFSFDRNSIWEEVFNDVSNFMLIE